MIEQLALNCQLSGFILCRNIYILKEKVVKMMDSLTGRRYRSGEGQRDDIIDKFFASQYV